MNHQCHLCLSSGKTQSKVQIEPEIDMDKQFQVKESKRTKKINDLMNENEVVNAENSKLKSLLQNSTKLVRECLYEQDQDDQEMIFSKLKKENDTLRALMAS